MTTGRPVVVLQLPENLVRGRTQQFLHEVDEFLDTERPQMVFDLSTVRELDTAGIEMLLHCMAEIMKLGGDLKLAAIPAAPAVILKITRVDRLFEIFETISDAADSFHRFTADAVEEIPPFGYADWIRAEEKGDDEFLLVA